jgi:isopenicillin N synthase-like dioxygenase
MTSFSSIPVLSLASARDSLTKPKFLEDLRSALLNVGFCYLSDTGLPPDLVKRVCEQSIAFFDEDVLPLAEKEKIEMKNEKSFLGWSRVSRVIVLLTVLSLLSATLDTKNMVS